MYWNGDYWTILPPGQRGQSIIIDQEGNPTWDCLIPNTADTTMSNLGQTLVVNTPITPIRIRTTGVTGISEQNLNLPQGLEASWSANVITILGTPTQAGNRDFSIYLEVSCGEPLSVTGLIDVSAVAPDAPTNVVATAGNGSASVAFVAPTNNGGIDITEYTVTSNPGSFTQTGTTSPISVTGLTNGTPYTFTVAARNLVGPSIESAPSAAVTPATVPDAPTGVVATAGNTSASVAFVAPSNNGGSEIDGYRVTSNPGGFSAFGATSPLNVTGLTNGTPYTFTVAAKNLVGPSIESAPSAAVTPAAPPSACPTATITYNSYSYKTVGIGNQCWMAENLRTRKYNDGTDIRFDNSGGTYGSTSQTWAGTGLNYGAYTIYANDSTATPSNLTSYGYLYNWYAVAGIITDGGTPATKNICPIGWHVPTDAEWTILTDTLGGENVAGRKMKSTGTTYWSSESTGTNDSSGFSALPGGYRFASGSFGNIRDYAFFWSATENASDYAWNLFLFANFATVRRSTDFNKPVGGSVRCLKNSSCTANTAAAPSSSPTLVVNTALTDITIATTGATGIDTINSGLPAGVTASWSANVITISGSPTAVGTFNYTFSLTGGCGSVNATGTITVTAAPSVCPTPTISYDYFFYSTVGIGSQCWLKQNLRTRYYNDGTEIRFDNSGGASGGGSGSTWGTLTSGAHTLYAHDSTPTTGNLAMYGYLYNGYAARGIITDGGTSTKNICPTGWHVPSDSDWKKLVKYIDSAADTTGATTQSAIAGSIMRESGFGALLGGLRDGGGFSRVSNEAYFLSTTDRTIPLPGGQSSIYTGFVSVNNNGNFTLNGTGTSRGRGMSVRCLKD
jgi:uncharacterized protein (TIGR02145 family)